MKNNVFQAKKTVMPINEKNKILSKKHYIIEKENLRPTR